MQPIVSYIGAPTQPRHSVRSHLEVTSRSSFDARKPKSAYLLSLAARVWHRHSAPPHIVAARLVPPLQNPELSTDLYTLSIYSITCVHPNLRVPAIPRYP
jgi:hypothetical protein